MATMTLLDMTQNILSSLNSDEVNSISDSTEATQVANIIKTTYFNIIPRAELTKHTTLFQLTASGDITKPTLMYRPDNISSLEWLKYDNDDPSAGDVGVKYEYVTILPITQFLDMVNTFNPNDTDVDSFTLSGISFYYKTDKVPQYCTVIQNYYVIFDSYRADLEDTLESTKTLCFGQVIPVFTLADSFVPDLDAELFPLLLNEAKSLAFLELKQTTHPKAEQEAKRQWSHLQVDKSLTNKPTYFEQIPSFGRR